MILLLIIALFGPGDARIYSGYTDTMDECRSLQGEYEDIARKRNAEIIRSECIIVGKQA